MLTEEKYVNWQCIEYNNFTCRRQTPLIPAMAHPPGFHEPSETLPVDSADESIGNDYAGRTTLLRGPSYGGRVAGIPNLAVDAFHSSRWQAVPHCCRNIPM